MNNTNEKIIKELQKGVLAIRAIARKYKVNVDRVRYYHYKLNNPEKFKNRFIDKALRWKNKKK